MGLSWIYRAVFSWILIELTAGTTLENDFDETRSTKGLFPNVFNLASTSNITANATCGETKTGAEIYCKLVEHVLLREDENRGHAKGSREPQCGVCNSTNTSPDKRHPVSNAIDGTNRWWQSPTLQNGKQYEWVTIALDLGEVYQVAYIIVKAAISPRPGNWILERSIDGIIYKPWQYYAISDSECWETYGIRPTIGKPRYRTDDEVICTSYYSKLNPLENGEIHTSLVNGRPGVDGPSMKLRDFTKARYVRLRLQKIRTLNADLMTLQSDEPERIDKSVTRRYFYSIKDISIGGQCVCSGHAETCSSDASTGKQRCVCEHNTCGENCERCCPLFNQKPWRPGTSLDGAACQKCECYGHADKCHYDPEVADKRESRDTDGKYEGGGVCDNCKYHTTGINCEQCEDGYYRPENVPRNHTRPCKKCQCNGPGMSGICVKDDSHRMEGLQAGDCLCRPGFTGKKCDRCAVGYRNYPSCDPCPCHSAGTVGGTTCDGDCVCKVHVEGHRCEKCKPGYFHLSAENPDGCSQCFCFGHTDQCTEGDWGIELIEKMEDWRVTDIRGRRAVRPTLYNGNLVIAYDEVSQFSTYYWLAPPDYLGKKLYSYGADVKFSVSYVVARGDTSGTYIEGPVIILEGNGDQFGYNYGPLPESEPSALTMHLREQGWFHMNPSGDNVGSVSREAFTLALNNMTRILIRAKYHTDQIEGRLHDIGMEIAAKESKSLKKLESVEKCECPPGYDGLSCEICAPGYRQVGTQDGGRIICQRCDCYNHAESCDADTGRCRNCMHNTTGLKCDRCVRGHYGDATVGTPDDCKRCACPLEIQENNFSPSCTAVNVGSDYICDRCPEGFQGDKCESCAEGYFGNPQIPGGYCQPCECSGNADTSQPGWCDRLTGQCLKCLGNTGGWNCGECLAGHYGNPERQECQPCSCNHHGSVSSQCDHTSGQCICKTRFVGRTCNRCADGYGNVEAGCETCRCNSMGSRTESCDPVTGICLCKPGVFGVSCDSCLEGHYGFSRQGCLECNCSPVGAYSTQCDESNGQCSCKPHVTGRACDRCEDGYWNINTGQGCEACQCNRTGSVASLCDKNTGQCSCKTGVGGKYCDHCQPGYYKFTARGCKKCDPCDIPGHICDPTNGRCVCPPFTTGRRCQMCVPNAWGYNPLTGCTACNCNIQGSPSQTCDSTTGNCVCLEGFEGRLCDQCRHGFHNFPSCFKCDCNVAGTDSTRCQLKDGICQCNERGQCICKENVVGQKCTQCTEGAFGLSADNPKGCHQCFCFGRTSNCDQASMAWSRVPFASRDVFMEIGTSEIPAVLGFHVVPDDLASRRLGIPYVLDKPLYWNLPKEALGDKVLSYNGFLTFVVESHSQSHFPDALLQRYPLVVLQGNHRIVLAHYAPAEQLRGPYRIRLYENEWKMRDNPQVAVRKEDLMVALQNVQTILIRATDGPDIKYARLHNTSLDTAVSSYQSSAGAEGIEMCRCPRQYTGTSCQDPAPGFYRKRKPNYLDSKDVLDLVGWAEPCACNNHTSNCDRETGVCIDCTGNTMGPNCDQCVKGFYGDPTRGPCRPCACPHPTNSFSDTCVPDAVDYVCIDCQTGYSGRHCERCASGFYGDPLREGGRCHPCNCNVYGSQKRDCDQNGQCTCHEGISGRDCTVCSHGFILTEYGCKSCGDECTGILLNELYQLQQQLNAINVDDIPRLPWGYLNKMSRIEQELRPLVTEYQRKVALGKQLVDDFTFGFDLEAVADMLYVKAKEYIAKANTVSADAKETLDDAEKLLNDLRKIRRDIEDLKNELDSFGMDPSGPILSVERLLEEAVRILADIESKDFGTDKANAERELRKAENLLDNVKKLSMDHGLLDNLKDKIDVLNNLLDDIIKRIDENVRKPARRALAIIQTSRSRYNEVKEIVGGVSGTLDHCNATLKEAADLLGQARSDVIIAAVKFQFLPRYVSDLENATDKLDERRSILARLNAQYKDQYVIPAQRHADELEKQSLDLNNLFSPTRELSKLPIEAVKAYRNIVDAINAAETAAVEAANAADTAYQQAYPEIGDALVDQAKKAKERSNELLIEAQKLNDIEIPVLESEMRARKKDLDKLGRDIHYGKRDNDVINRELDALPKGVGDSLSGIDAKVQDAKVKADTADDKVDRIIHNIENDMKPKLESLQAGTVGGLENITRIIQQAQEEVRVASRLADSADTSARRVSKQNSIMRLNLKELKDKILLARQKASSIKVAVTGDAEGKCVRSLKPPTEPSTTNNIVLNYAIKSDKPNSMLFFLGSTEQEDFMAIEMVSRKIRFLWNAGGGTQVIEHSRTIETNSEQLLKNEQWFKIEVNRIGNLATLSVKRTPDGQKPDPSEVTGASPVGFTKMDLDSSSKLFIGGFPEDYVKPSDMRTSSFAGCLYEVMLDGKPVGLWNFISNEGCDGCKEGATEEVDISAYEFQGGNSYAIMPQIPYYRKSDLYIALSFKTLNEDGLLLFAGNPKSNDFISIELKEGKIVYQLKFGDRSHILLRTVKKYNTGDWVRVEAARDRYEAQMHIGDERLENSGSKQGSSVLDLQRMPIYFGGVPPNFTLERWPGITFTSYFGCLKDMQIDSTPFALSRGSFYGMVVGCSNRPVRVGTFKGSGFLELNSQPILSDSSLAFSFFTKQKDALLLVSTFSGQDTDEEKLQNYYSISVKDGKIEARFNSGTGEISMVSDQSLTAGVFHTVSVIRKNRKLALRVDDVEEAEIRLSRGARDVSAPENGGLFIGGVKEGVSVDNMVASPQKLIGIITDVVFNDRLMSFENTVGHMGVDFGQPDVSSLPVDPLQHIMALTHPSDSCYSSYALLEKDTVSFRGTHDFIQYTLAKKDLLKNFNVSFEFRTFNENGIILAVKNDRKKQQLAVYIKENYIVVDFRRKKEHKNILSHNELSHGEWHMVGLSKSGKILSLHLNNKKIASTHIPKKLSFKNPLYIGGMPTDATSEVTSSGYRGCFRNLIINGDVKKLPGTDRLCFSEVDRGLYFTGSGYATYDSSFNTSGKQLVVNILFRTTEVNGILLNFHDEFSGLWFKLQLVDGEVVTTMFQEKSSRMYKISSSFDSKYDMCDNKWHAVMAAYKGSTLTLALDRLKSVHSEVEKSHTEFKPTTLYIGGTPKKYRHLFASERDFVGCLQSISVNGENINFERVNTHFPTVHHSCPQL